MDRLSKKLENGSGKERKPYKTPKLEKYGDLREITQAVGVAGLPDGMTGTGMQNTH